MHVDVSAFFDVDAERARLTKEIAQRRGHAESLEKKLANQNFVSRAPAEVVQQQRQLAQAEAAEAAARAAWHSARLALERAAGTTLETYGVSFDEARRGEVARAPAEPPAGSNN